MKVKKFIANSMNEAMKQIREELGSDAVILNSKEVQTGGFLGFFTKKQLEVIAAVDPSINQVSSQRKRIEEKQLASSRRTEKLENSIPDLSKDKNDDIMAEINQLKALIQGLSVNKETEQKQYPEPFQQIDNQLKEQGVVERVRLILLKNLLKNWYEQSHEERTKADPFSELKHHLENIFRKVPIGPITFNKKIVNIVGPTGVGKTTTIAKIAAHSVLKKQKKVALITTDTYRIAAVEQLKTYAKILNIPLEVAYSIEDFKKAIEQFSHYDLILVDSAGRNFRNQLFVEELSKVIDFQSEAETHLVLSLTAKYEDMKAIIQQFGLIPIEKIIFTKKDETNTYGALLNVAMELEKGIAYITTGQDVPDDIVEATIPFLTKCILEVDKHE